MTSDTRLTEQESVSTSSCGSESPARAQLAEQYSSNALRQATRVQQQVLSVPHFNAAEVQRVLGGQTADQDVSKHELRRLRSQGTMLGVRCGRHGFVYPAFQLDVAGRRVHPVAARINRLLRLSLTVEQSVAWWLTSGSASPAARYTTLDRDGDLTADAVALRASRGDIER